MASAVAFVVFLAAFYQGECYPTVAFGEVGAQSGFGSTHGFACGAGWETGLEGGCGTGECYPTIAGGISCEMGVQSGCDLTYGIAGSAGCEAGLQEGCCNQFSTCEGTGGWGYGSHGGLDYDCDQVGCFEGSGCGDWGIGDYCGFGSDCDQVGCFEGSGCGDWGIGDYCGFGSGGNGYCGTECLELDCNQVGCFEGSGCGYEKCGCIEGLDCEFEGCGCASECNHGRWGAGGNCGLNYGTSGCFEFQKGLDCCGGEGYCCDEGLEYECEDCGCANDCIYGVNECCGNECCGNQCLGCECESCGSINECNHGIHENECCEYNDDCLDDSCGCGCDLGWSGKVGCRVGASCI